MVKALPAPKVINKQVALLAYPYAALLAVLAVVQLMGLGGFNFAHISYQTLGSPQMIILVAALEIFAIPFLLRLTLSPLARFFSALFALVTPFFIGAHMAYLISQNIQPMHWLEAAGVAVLAVVACLCFWALNGAATLRFPKK